MQTGSPAPSRTAVLPGEPRAALTERRYLRPLILIAGLFFLWAIGVNLNDILIPHLKQIFALSDFQSSFIQVAFFGGYFVAAWPAGRLIRRIGYKAVIVTGLLICALGASLFLPAASLGTYALFLAGLFLLACGQSFLEVAANPYVAALGPASTAEQRLNLVQSINAVGALLTPILGSAFILARSEAIARRYPGIAEHGQVQALQAQVVRLPYMFIIAAFAGMAGLVLLTTLPTMRREPATRDAASADNPGLIAVLCLPQIWRGVLAQFCYVGAQVGSASFVIRLAEHQFPSLDNSSASLYLKLHLLGFVAGRFLGAALMRRFQPARLLALFAAAALVCAVGVVAGVGYVVLGAVVLLGFFNSIMYPTIFSLTIHGIGQHVETASSLLVMAILGGALVPGSMGLLSDHFGIQRAFLVPGLCYLPVLTFAIWMMRHKGLDPAGSAAEELRQQ